MRMTRAARPASPRRSRRCRASRCPAGPDRLRAAGQRPHARACARAGAGAAPPRPEPAPAAATAADSQPQQSSPSKSSGKPQAKSEGSRQQTTNGPKVTAVTGKPESEPKSTGSSGGGGGHAKPGARTPRRPTKPSTAPRAAPPPPRTRPSRSPPRPGPVGVPNFFIDKFRIPPFLLPIYQAAGIQYNVPWQVLAAINEIETDYGRNLSVSSAGALGWMQFMPSSWRTYGVDANNDGRKDPYNPVDAIFAAARYLKAAGADKDIRKAIFAYNHANWYVDSVMLRAKLIGGLPAGLVGSLTGLTQGHFPVHARARYADDAAEQASRRATSPASATQVVDSNANRRSINIYARQGAPVIAVQDGEIKQIGESRGSASTSSSRTPTATSTRTRTWARSRRPTIRRPSPRHRSRSARPRRSSKLPKTRRRPRRPLGQRAGQAEADEQGAAAEGRAAEGAPPPTAGARRHAPPRPAVAVPRSVEGAPVRAPRRAGRA